MDGNLSTESEWAICSAPGNGSECQSFPGNGTNSGLTPASGSDSDEWFYDVAQGVLGKDAGLHLHYLTGYPQSSCYAYVAKDKAKRRRPPDHFLRTLFHSKQGEPFYNAFMQGCDAPWWLAKQERAQRRRELLRELERLE